MTILGDTVAICRRPPIHEIRSSGGLRLRQVVGGLAGRQYPRLNNGGAVNALIVDDSRAMRMMLGKMLQDLGYETLDAANGVEALKQLENHRGIRLALVDWNMPEMSGYEFVCTVRKNPAFDGLMLMMVTTETEMSQVAKALEAGANEYVMKPFTREIIVEKLALLGMEVG